TGWLARQGVLRPLSRYWEGAQPKTELYFVSNFSTLDLVDRERFTCRLMTLVRKDDEVHQRGKEGIEPVVLLLAEPRVEKGFEAAAHAVAPDVPSSGGSGMNQLPQPLGAGVEGGEEAILFVGEVLIEGRSGNPGSVDHVLDVGFQVPELGGGVQHGAEQA